MTTTRKPRGISKKALAELTDRFEGALDYVAALDRFPFYVKREAAEKAAVEAIAAIAKAEGKR